MRAIEKKGHESFRREVTKALKKGNEKYGKEKLQELFKGEITRAIYKRSHES